jgi:hypothetical protein
MAASPARLRWATCRPLCSRGPRDTRPCLRRADVRAPHAQGPGARWFYLRHDRSGSLRHALAIDWVGCVGTRSVLVQSSGGDAMQPWRLRSRSRAARACARALSRSLSLSLALSLALSTGWLYVRRWACCMRVGGLVIYARVGWLNMRGWAGYTRMGWLYCAGIYTQG